MEKAVFTLECDTLSDESTTKRNCIEEFDDSDDDILNDGMLNAAVIPTQITTVVDTQEQFPILSPEKSIYGRFF